MTRPEVWAAMQPLQDEIDRTAHEAERLNSARMHAGDVALSLIGTKAHSDPILSNLSSALINVLDRKLRDAEQAMDKAGRAATAEWERLTAVPPKARPRLLSCVEQWPGCTEGDYDPKCCRFPKSCSCTVYSDDIDSELLEST